MNIIRALLFFIVSFLFSFSLFSTSCVYAANTNVNVNANPKHQPSSHQKAINAIKDFEIHGKVAYKHKKEGGNANIYWFQQGNQYYVRLSGAIGTQSVTIKGHPNSITLRRSNGYKVTAKSPEALLYQELKWHIPVTGLQHWIRGLPSPGNKPTNQVYDEEHRLKSLHQQGWNIEYLNYKSVNGIDLPSKIQLSNGPFKIKFIIKKWVF